MEYVLETENLEFTYLDGTKALRNLSLQIPRGKKIAVLGKNGAGKSTLFLHFNGINRPENGVVKYKGETISYDKPSIKKLRKNVGLVFQDPDDQLFSASVYQDVSFGPLNLGWPEDVVRLKVEEALRRTGIWELRDKAVHYLSQGEKKRAAIAGVIAMEPEVLILDEPNSGLDSSFSEEFLQLLQELNEKGTTVIISSHNTDEVYTWADYVFVINEGSLLAEGTPEVVFRRQEVLEKANLVKPWVVEVYDHLVSCGRLPVGPKQPRTRKELLEMIAK